MSIDRAIELLDEAYKNIDEGLEENKYANLEYRVSLGLDNILETKRELEKLKGDK